MCMKKFDAEKKDSIFNLAIFCWLLLVNNAW